MFRGLNKRVIYVSGFFLANIFLVFILMNWISDSPSDFTDDLPKTKIRQNEETFGKRDREQKYEQRNGKHLKQRISKPNLPRAKIYFKLNKNFHQKQNDYHHSNMLKLHRNVYYHTSDQEISDFFLAGKLSSARLSKILDPVRDRLLLKTFFRTSNQYQNRLINQLHLKLNVNDTKIILLWSTDETSTWLNDFDSKDCNVKNCIITDDQLMKNLSHAIIFTDLVSTKKLSKFSSSQVKIFYRIESPINSNFILSDGSNKAFHMNWSATYRRDSVVPTPYEYFAPFLNMSKLPVKPLRDFSYKKKKLIAWFASNCYTHNGRMNYVLQLQKYIDVDIFGNCGVFQCERGDAECDEILKDEYKFYLAFENGNCKDYVTEKLFWNALRNDVVPIVMGAHPDEYKHIAPPRSFIHVDMFKSPKQLAQYLHFLNENDDLYNSYFLWKRTGEFIDTKFLCRLCAMVNLAPQFPMWYENANNWWHEGCDRFLNIDGYSSWSGTSRDLHSNITYMFD